MIRINNITKRNMNQMKIKRKLNIMKNMISENTTKNPKLNMLKKKFKCPIQHSNKFNQL